MINCKDAICRENYILKKEQGCRNISQNVIIMGYDRSNQDDIHQIWLISLRYEDRCDPVEDVGTITQINISRHRWY